MGTKQSTRWMLCRGRRRRGSGEVIIASRGAVCARFIGITKVNVVITVHEIGERVGFAVQLAMDGLPYGIVQFATDNAELHRRPAHPRAPHIAC
jgi:hypothetical protein